MRTPVDARLRFSPPLQPRRLRLQCVAVLAFILAFDAATADPARAAPPACVVSAGARSFDLAELGGGGAGAGGAPPLRLVSRAADSLGWTYSFAACGAVAPLPAACAGAAPGSAALQQTPGACYGLGAAASRAVAATATGVALSFSGGDGGRSSVVTVECEEVVWPYVVRWGHGAAPGSYTALVRARAGCALECARNSAGAVCGGRANGACVVASDGNDSAHCVCSKSWFGEACSDRIEMQPSSSFSADDSHTLPSLAFVAFLLAASALSMRIITAASGSSMTASGRSWARGAIASSAALLFFVFGSTARTPSELRKTSVLAPRVSLTRQLHVMFGLIGRDVANELPYVLSNIEHLSKLFLSSHVVFVENDSSDGTESVFDEWARQAVHPLSGKRHSVPVSNVSRNRKNNKLLAEARNVYLQELQKPENRHISFLIAVDTDMCVPWDVDTMASVLSNLLPLSGTEWYALSANGVETYGACKLTRAVNYEDRFALVDLQGRRFVSSGPGPFVSLPPGFCSHGAGALDASEPTLMLPCITLGGEAVSPVQGAFGGWTMYRADLFHHNDSCAYSSPATPPTIPTVLFPSECEHVPLNDCLARQQPSSRFIIASRLFVGWEGCEGPVYDEHVDGQLADCKS
jgi:hypothetical protein